MMCNLVEGRCKSFDIPPDSELKQVEGIMEELKVVEMNTGARILVRGEEVYVPAGEKDHMMDVLHLGHHSAESMIRNCKSRVFFPGIRKKLQEKYDNCAACTLYRVSRMSPKTEVDYSDIFSELFSGPNARDGLFAIQWG